MRLRAVCESLERWTAHSPWERGRPPDVSPEAVLDAVRDHAAVQVACGEEWLVMSSVAGRRQFADLKGADAAAEERGRLPRPPRWRCEARRPR